MNFKNYIICFLAFLSFRSFSQEPAAGYILETRDNKVYLDLKEGEVEAGNIFNVYKKGGYFIHPVSGDSIKEEDSIISQLIIDEVKLNYSIANAFPPESISLLKRGMTVLGADNFQVKHKKLEKSVSVKPIQGSRTYGFLLKYAVDFMTEYLLRSDSFRVFEPEPAAIQADRIITDTGIVLTETAKEQYLSGRLSEYEITTIIYEPFVIDLSTQKQIKTNYITNAYGFDMPSGRNKTVRVLKNYSPAKAEIKPLKAVIKAALQVSSVKTGEIVFFCTEMQEFEASGDLNIERGFLTGVSVPGGDAAFKNTITGRAAELAIQNLCGYINAFFDGKIDSSSYTGNVISDFHSDYKIMISDLRQKGDISRIKFISRPATVYHAILNSGKNMNIRNKEYLDICLTPDKLTGSSIKSGKEIKIGYLRVSETNIETSEGDAVFKVNINPVEFSKEESYLRIKNQWNTVFFLARMPAFKIKESNVPDVTEKEITYSGIGYMLNYKVGFYGYLGFGNTFLKSGTSSAFNTYYGGLGITKSIGRNTNIGAGLTFHYSTVKYIGFDTIHSIDLLGSTRLKNNINIIYGCSIPKGNQENISLSLGFGYSF
jgi:hypothetical protein